MNYANLIISILDVVEPILTVAGVIPTPYAPLAAGIVSAITVVKQELTNSNGQITVTALSVTQAIAAGLAALEAQKALPASPGASLAIALADAAAAGSAAFVAAGAKVDPSLLQPETPVA